VSAAREKQLPRLTVHPSLYFTFRLFSSSVNYDAFGSTQHDLAAIADPPSGDPGTTHRGEATVTDLAKPFAMTLPAISKHLKVLERAGLIERSREAQWRPCRLRARPLKEAADWIERYRALWRSDSTAWLTTSMNFNDRRRQMTTTSNDSDREIVLTRVFDAPRELVWKVWTDPGQVIRWWVPADSPPRPRR